MLEREKVTKLYNMLLDAIELADECSKDSKYAESTWGLFAAVNNKLYFLAAGVGATLGETVTPADLVFTDEFENAVESVIGDDYEEEEDDCDGYCESGSSGDEGFIEEDERHLG